LYINFYLLNIFFIRERIEINKKKLLEIARKNVISMIKQGTLSVAQQDKAIAAIQTGGKTVDELTGNFLFTLILLIILYTIYIYIIIIYVIYNFI